MKYQYLRLFIIVILVLTMITCRGVRSPVSSALESSGIYMTAFDLAANRLGLEVDCKKEKHKIKTHDFLGKPYIHVIHQGKGYKYQKSEIYGYRDCDGNNYRFVNNSEYKILESKNFTLYEISVLKPNPDGKGSKNVSEYYFSVRPDSELKLLTVFNLKNAFPNDHNFHDQLDTTFKYDKDLIEYDGFHKSYKINHLLQTTLQK